MRNPDHRHYPHGPKILPWLAHKAGISEHRAEMLWQAALRHADHVASKAGDDIPSSAYWQTAMNHLDELIAAEAQREDVASFGWRPWSAIWRRFGRRAWQYWTKSPWHRFAPGGSLASRRPRHGRPCPTERPT